MLGSSPFVFNNFTHPLKYLLGPASSHQPSKSLRERRTTDLPLLDMHTVTREEGEGMETTDSESVSSAGTHIQSLEQLLSSPDSKLGRSPRVNDGSWFVLFLLLLACLINTTLIFMLFRAIPVKDTTE